MFFCQFLLGGLWVCYEVLQAQLPQLGFWCTRIVSTYVTWCSGAFLLFLLPSKLQQRLLQAALRLACRHLGTIAARHCWGLPLPIAVLAWRSATRWTGYKRDGLQFCPDPSKICRQLKGSKEVRNYCTFFLARQDIWSWSQLNFLAVFGGGLFWIRPCIAHCGIWTCRV